MRGIGWWLIGLLVLTSVPAVASEGKAESEGAYTHDGFFMRFSAGPAFGFLFGDRRRLMLSETLSLGGSIDSHWLWHLGLGGAVSPNFFEGEGQEGPMMLLAEVGGAYYFDNNVHLGLAMGWGVAFTGEQRLATCLSLTGQCNSTERVPVTEDMATIRLSGGREWWVSENWALGLEGNLTIPIYTEADDDEMPAGMMLGLRFTATYH